MKRYCIWSYHAEIVSCNLEHFQYYRWTEHFQLFYTFKLYFTKPLVDPRDYSLGHFNPSTLDPFYTFKLYFTEPLVDPRDYSLGHFNPSTLDLLFPLLPSTQHSEDRATTLWGISTHRRSSSLVLPPSYPFP